jgi:hypothetical protein
LANVCCFDVVHTQGHSELESFLRLPGTGDALVPAGDAHGGSDSDDGLAVSSAAARRHPFHEQHKICYRLVGPPQLTFCFDELVRAQQGDRQPQGGALSSTLQPGMGRLSRERCVVGAEVFSPIPWWRGQSMSVGLDEVRASFPDAVATHFGYSTNAPLVVDKT